MILGAGLFGLYGADVATRLGHRVAIVDPEPLPITRASFANQARIHLGYHYPRSVGTAVQSLSYKRRFCEEFASCINSNFTKLYAISQTDSMTSADGFERFCHAVDIPAVHAEPTTWFREGAVEAVFVCDEASFDAIALRKEMVRRLDARHVDWRLNTRVASVRVNDDSFDLTLEDGSTLSTARVLNATYSSCNQVLAQFGFDPLPVRYELCELVLGRAAPALAPVGITVMDGPFFSLMPYGLSGRHSLSAVDYTPHYRCEDALPRFPCQAENPRCTPQALENCGTCPAHPPTLARDMQQLANRYLRPELAFEPDSSIFAIRPVLKISDVDDSRPTLVYRHAERPEFVSVLSGKINTIYDMEQLW